MQLSHWQIPSCMAISVRVVHLCQIHLSYLSMWRRIRPDATCRTTRTALRDVLVPSESSSGSRSCERCLGLSGGAIAMCKRLHRILRFCIPNPFFTCMFAGHDRTIYVCLLTTTDTKGLRDIDRSQAKYSTQVTAGPVATSRSVRELLEQENRHRLKPKLTNAGRARCQAPLEPQQTAQFLHRTPLLPPPEDTTDSSDGAPSRFQKCRTVGQQSRPCWNGFALSPSIMVWIAADWNV